MNLPDFLTEQLDGDIVLTGHRIDLWHVVKGYQSGYSPEMLVCQYPSLPLALVHKTIAFYLEHRVEVDLYIAKYDKDLHRLRNDQATPLDVAALRERLELLQKREPASIQSG